MPFTQKILQSQKLKEISGGIFKELFLKLRGRKKHKEEVRGNKG